MVRNTLVSLSAGKPEMEKVKLFCARTFIPMLAGLLPLHAAESTVLKSDRQLAAAKSSEASSIKAFRSRLERIDAEVKAYRELELQQLPAFSDYSSRGSPEFFGSGIPTAMGTGALAGAATGAAVSPNNPEAGAGMGVAVGGLGGLIVALIAQEVRNAEMRKIGEENKRRVEAERNSMRRDVEIKVRAFRQQRLIEYRAELEEAAAAHLVRIQEVPQ
jgi:hypothetical protein